MELKGSILIGIIIPPLLLTLLLTTQISTHNNYAKSTAKELATTLEFEKRNLEIPIETKIEVQLANHSTAFVEKISKNHYRITLGGEMADKSSLKHELYHIKAGHLEQVNENQLIEALHYIVIKEPTATLYQISK